MSDIDDWGERRRRRVVWQVFAQIRRESGRFLIERSRPLTYTDAIAEVNRLKRCGVCAFVDVLGSHPETKKEGGC